jgi:hypothetical protein
VLIKSTEGQTFTPDAFAPVRKEGTEVNSRTMRSLLTILMYAGVGIFLLPYLVGKASTALLLMLLGGAMAVICGLLRCYLTEDE